MVLENLSLLDCTLRDGGYYTKWDFEPSLVEDYIKTINQLPINLIEIGYRSKPKADYEGAYYYMPKLILDKISALSRKPLVIILNEKEVSIGDVDELLNSCIGSITMVRLAIAPKNLDRALNLAARIKNMGFSVCLNVMYASTWSNVFIEHLDPEKINKSADVFYVVDSYGGIYPEGITHIIQQLKNKINLKIGFHGHNNLELALINSLSAINAGAEFIDSTFGGMGRGAGNLSTELLLTVLHQKKYFNVDFDLVNGLTSKFSELKKVHGWGTNLPYMVSGAFSLPQDTLVSQVKKRYFSINSIIEEVSSPADSLKLKFPVFGAVPAEKVLIVGGGVTPNSHSEALISYLSENPDIVIIHSSSKNISNFSRIENLQFHCLPGFEGRRFEKLFTGDINSHFLVLPPLEYSLSEYIPLEFQNRILRLESLSFLADTEVSATAMAFEIAKNLKANSVLLTGFDGYSGAVTREERELFEENQFIFQKALQNQFHLFSVTPSLYEVPFKSIYSLI